MSAIVIRSIRSAVGFLDRSHGRRRVEIASFISVLCCFFPCRRDGGAPVVGRPEIIIVRRRGRHARLGCVLGHRKPGLDAVSQDGARLPFGLHRAAHDDDLVDLHQFAVGGPHLGEQHYIHLAVQVFQGDEGHRLPFLGVQRAQPGHQPGQRDRFGVPTRVQFAAAGGDDALQVGQLVLQRVLGQIDADEFLLPVEQLAPVDRLDVLLRPQDSRVQLGAAGAAEEGELPGLGRGVAAGAVAHEAVERVDHPRPRPPLTEHADAGHRLQCPLAHAP